MSRLADALKIVTADAEAAQREADGPPASQEIRPEEVIQEPLKHTTAGSRIFPAVLPPAPDDWQPGPDRDGLLAGGPNMLPLPTEQYRRLAAVLHHAQGQKGLRTLIVSSAIGGEGKSLTTSNLALTLALSYRRRVLLIDADLRRPTLSFLFQQPDGEGLNEHLRSPVVRQLPIVQVAPRLYLVPAGRPESDPVGSLTSERMRRVVAEATERFDWVIIDTPPVALLPDAKLISSMADGAILVVRSGYSPIDLIKRAIETLGHERIFGVVFNGAEAQKHGSKAYYGYYGPGKRPKR
jgi:capsular exopolysaccharide synthesis family protein